MGVWNLLFIIFNDPNGILLENLLFIKKKVKEEIPSFCKLSVSEAYKDYP